MWDRNEFIEKSIAHIIVILSPFNRRWPKPKGPRKKTQTKKKKVKISNPERRKSNKTTHKNSKNLSSLQSSFSQF